MINRIKKNVERWCELSSELEFHLKDHSHDPLAIKNELIDLLGNSRTRIEFLTAAATPLFSVATSASVLTFLSLQLFINGSTKTIRLLAGINIIFLLFMVFIALVTQVMIHRARLRLARVNHDLQIQEILDKEQLSPEEIEQLLSLSHLALKSQSTINRIQWLYNNGLFRLLYFFIAMTVSVLILLVINEIIIQL
jgi:hypothetical protein